MILVVAWSASDWWLGKTGTSLTTSRRSRPKQTVMRMTHTVPEAVMKEVGFESTPTKEWPSFCRVE